jgi:hypothetical protein
MITLYDHLDEVLEDENKKMHSMPLRHILSEFMEDLGYCDESDVNKALLRAFEVCCTLQISIPAHFEKFYRFHDNRLEVDWLLSDLGCYLLLINGNSCNPTVAKAQLRAIIFSRTHT